jgi:hypothetical protein
MLMIDLFAGRLGWSKGFLAEGWTVRAYDLNLPNIEIPHEVEFLQVDVLSLTAKDLLDADFICASSPCEQFSVHCMKHFHPNPKYPELGIRLFEHTRSICEASGLPYVMENVRCAEKFVGRAVNHCGPFYLWGTGVPAMMTKECYQVTKGFGKWDRKYILTTGSSKSKKRQELKAKWAEIPLAISQYIAQCATQMVTL